MIDFTQVDRTLTGLCSQGKVPSATLCVYHRGRIVHEGAYGYPDPEGGAPATLETRYDMASLTKLFCSTAFMRLVEQGVFSLEERVCESFPAFTGMRDIVPMANELDKGQTDASVHGQCDAGLVTWYHVLTHTSGMGWLAMNKRPSLEAALQEILTMPFAYATGSTVLYTDLGLILMGLAMEKRTGILLDDLVDQLVAQPLGLTHTGYLRNSAHRDTTNVAPTEFCAWRGYRVRGCVHDENAFLLDGVAGHAGLFSTARDAATLCQDYLTSYQGGKGLISTGMVRRMASFQAQNDWDRRGIAWQLRLLDPEAHSYPLSANAFGHTGFTGTCMWIDPDRDMTFALLTNEVYNGRENRALIEVRGKMVRALVAAVDAEAAG